MPPETGQEQFIPQWAAQLGISVAKIEARTDEIPSIIQELKDLRANTVPMQEHIKLLNDVDVLKERDLGARSDWEDMRQRVLSDKGMLPVIWDERAQMRGAIRFIQVWVGVVSFLLLLLSILVAAHNAGVHVST